MKKFSLKTLLILFTLLLLWPAQAAIADDGCTTDDWPMFHHDLALSGVSSSRAPNTNAILWTFPTSGPIFSSPAVTLGKVFIASENGDVYALDAFTGMQLWKTSTQMSIYSSPAVSDGLVYILAESNGNGENGSLGTLFALSAEDGSIAWTQTGGAGNWHWGSPAVHNGRVFIPLSDGYMYCLNAANGNPIWSTDIGGGPNSMTAVVNGKVYAGTHNMSNSSPTLVALDETDGSIIWTYDYHLYHGGIAGMINCNGVAVADGDGDRDLEVYFGVYNWFGVDDQAVCLDEATGLEVWTQDVGDNTTSTPAVHNGRVFIGSDDNNLYALDAGTGGYIWNYPTNDRVLASPAVADGKVFVGSEDHTFYAIDEITGALIWSYYTGASRLLSSPAVAYGNVYVGNENSNVYAFGTTYCIAFDRYPYEGGEIPSLTLLDDIWASWGVIIDAESMNTWFRGAYAGRPGDHEHVEDNIPTSGPNFCKTCAYEEDVTSDAGEFIFTFEYEVNREPLTVNYVSVWFLDVEMGGSKLQAYDLEREMVAEVVVPPGPNANQFFAEIEYPGIHYVKAIAGTPDPNGNSASLDCFCYTLEPNLWVQQKTSTSPPQAPKKSRGLQ